MKTQISPSLVLCFIIKLLKIHVLMFISSQCECDTSFRDLGVSVSSQASVPLGSWHSRRLVKGFTKFRDKHSFFFLPISRFWSHDVVPVCLDHSVSFWGREASGAELTDEAGLWTQLRTVLKAIFLLHKLRLSQAHARVAVTEETSAPTDFIYSLTRDADENTFPADLCLGSS